MEVKDEAFWNNPAIKFIKGIADEIVIVYSNRWNLGDFRIDRMYGGRIIDQN